MIKLNEHQKQIAKYVGTAGGGYLVACMILGPALLQVQRELKTHHRAMETMTKIINDFADLADEDVVMQVYHNNEFDIVTFGLEEPDV